MLTRARGVPSTGWGQELWDSPRREKKAQDGTRGRKDRSPRRTQEKWPVMGAETRRKLWDAAERGRDPHCQMRHGGTRSKARAGPWTVLVPMRPQRRSAVWFYKTYQSVVLMVGGVFNFAQLVPEGVAGSVWWVFVS